MKKESEIIDDEELKRFFLNEAMLLCPSALGDVLEREKLQILYNTLQKIVKLLGVLNHCNLEMHYVEIYHVFGFYFTEKDGEIFRGLSVRCFLSSGRFSVQSTIF